MGKITNEMVHEAYKIGKSIFQKEISRLEGVSKLEKIGMNQSSAKDYIYSYANLIQGKLFTRNTNTYATGYYLEQIYQEEGISGLKNALLSLSQHIDYYEQVSGTNVGKRKEVFLKYSKLIPNQFTTTIYPDEVDPQTTYPEGKVKEVVVNTFERNPIARTKCIEHYGTKCQVCDFDFELVYGVLGKNFIHVHHLVDISTIGKEYSVNPLTDLIPVCPNCHAMLHKKQPAYKIEELKSMLIL